MKNGNTRSMNSIRNIVTGIGGQIINILLGFVSRTIFIKALGVEYLGVSGLFSNILTILNISELGINTAIVFSLYKPLTENDRIKIAASVKLLKRVYKIIGFIVLIIGLLILPFLPYIIKEKTEIVNLNVIYLIYLAQSVLSYWFFSYKNSILQADQKQYVASLIGYIITFSVHALQILVLICIISFDILTASTGFIIYLLINMIFVIIKNLLVSLKVDKLYPYLSEKELRKQTEGLDETEKRDIFKNVIGLSCYKISGTVLTSTDNVIITHFVNVASTGLYSNYTMILAMVTTVISVIFTSFTAGIGNLYVTESSEKSEFIFRCLNFLNFWVYGVASVCLFNLANPFIELWIGKDFLLSEAIVLVIVLNFLSDGLQNAVILYKDACGLFWHGKLRPIASAVLNIVFSVILVQYMGITGVLLGTILSRFLTTWWYDAMLVHKKVFNISPSGYYIRYVRSILIVSITAAITYKIAGMLTYGSWLTFIATGALSFIFPNFVFIILFRHTSEYKYIKEMILNILNHVFKK